MAPSGTARSTPATACVSPNDFSSAVASIASGACVVMGVLTDGPCRTCHLFRHRVRRPLIGLQRFSLVESCGLVAISARWPRVRRTGRASRGSAAGGLELLGVQHRAAELRV